VKAKPWSLAPINLSLFTGFRFLFFAGAPSGAFETLADGFLLEELLGAPPFAEAFRLVAALAASSVCVSNRGSFFGPSWILTLEPVVRIDSIIRFDIGLSAVVLDAAVSVADAAGVAGARAAEGSRVTNRALPSALKATGSLPRFVTTGRLFG